MNQEVLNAAIRTIKCIQGDIQGYLDGEWDGNREGWNSLVNSLEAVQTCLEGDLRMEEIARLLSCERGGDTYVASSDGINAKIEMLIGNEKGTEVPIWTGTQKFLLNLIKESPVLPTHVHLGLDGDHHDSDDFRCLFNQIREWAKQKGV